MVSGFRAHTEGGLLHALALVLTNTILAPISADAVVKLLQWEGPARDGRKFVLVLLELQAEGGVLTVPKAHSARLERPTLFQEGDPAILPRHDIPVKLDAGGVPRGAQL